LFVNNCKIRTRYEETDQMGVIYYGNYYRYFEVARTEWLRKLGLSCRDMEDMGIYLPVVESYCKYIHSVNYDDVITIKTWVSKFTGVRIKFEYNVLREGEDDVLAKGFTTMALTNGEKAINLKRHNRKVYDIIKSGI